MKTKTNKKLTPENKKLLALAGTGLAANLGGHLLILGKDNNSNNLSHEKLVRLARSKGVNVHTSDSKFDNYYIPGQKVIIVGSDKPGILAHEFGHSQQNQKLLKNVGTINRLPTYGILAGGALGIKHGIDEHKGKKVKHGMAKAFLIGAASGLPTLALETGANIRAAKVLNRVGGSKVPLIGSELTYLGTTLAHGVNSALAYKLSNSVTKRVAAKREANKVKNYSLTSIESEARTQYAYNKLRSKGLTHEQAVKRLKLRYGIVAGVSELDLLGRFLLIGRLKRSRVKSSLGKALYQGTRAGLDTLGVEYGIDGLINLRNSSTYNQEYDKISKNKDPNEDIKLLRDKKLLQEIVKDKHKDPKYYKYMNSKYNYLPSGLVLRGSNFLEGGKFTGNAADERIRLLKNKVK